MIKFFQKSETDKYIIIKILFVKITIKKKFYEINKKIDNLYLDMHRRFDDLYPFMWDRFGDIQYNFDKTQKEIYISRQLYSKLLIENKFNNSNNLPLVSIIIPVYNIGEKYLRQCLESVINQSYKNIEIIIVNDCSVFEEDEKIILEYASKDNRIKYIKHKENMGDGAARMTGLKEAKGYSVLFADGDDYMSLDLIEIAIFEMIKNNVDIVCYNFFIVREENNKIEFNNSYYKNIPHQVLYGKNIMDLFCNLDVYASGHLWSKLIKREILLELGFDNIPARYKCKDLNYAFKIFLKAKRISYIPLNLYFYIEGNINSICNSIRFKDNFFTDMYYIYSDMFDFINKESNEEITKLLASNYLWLYYTAIDFDNAKVREENHFINIFKKVILDLIDYGAIDKEKLLENVKNITNDKNLINWLCNIKFTL
ncbi:glycosyltransferase family 2 protein [Brachyspira aalborgi]|uniref:Glycosyltransferase family 2 protein n=1 Tax=Brachyspira aalborgi TaxID=29522 RepID=A0A5C8G529_9SPIR|nr:glycosyltransferase family 2 protein [Brachyspira aalborgi]TXJ57132.1 glycosyltransferase family 2 protein [Brachyspira aalborgi]